MGASCAGHWGAAHCDARPVHPGGRPVCLPVQSLNAHRMGALAPHRQPAGGLKDPAARGHLVVRQSS